MASYSHTWSGTTLGPFTGTQFGNGHSITVSGGVASVYTGSAPDGTKVSGNTYSTAMAGPLHFAEITYYSRGGAPFPRAAGVLVGGNSATPTTGVFCGVTVWADAAATQIMTLDSGTTFTQRAYNGTMAATGDIIKMEITRNGAHYVYTVYKNGSSVLSWEDTGDIITPGNYVGPATVATYNTGTLWWPQGATAFAANDDASMASIMGISSITGIASITV